MSHQYAWASAFGATSAFATTWALRQIANRYFESGRTADLKDLKKETLNEQRKAGTQAETEYAGRRARPLPPAEPCSTRSIDGCLRLRPLHGSTN